MEVKPGELSHGMGMQLVALYFPVLFTELEAFSRFCPRTAADFDAVAGAPRPRQGGVHDLLGHSRRPRARLCGLPDSPKQAAVMAGVRGFPKDSGGCSCFYRLVFFIRGECALFYYFFDRLTFSTEE